jgi:hypothetical protein
MTAGGALPNLPAASSIAEVPVVIEVLPIGSSVRCACPRSLIAERITGRISRRPDGGIHFPAAARHVALRVDHRQDCQPSTHEHYNVCVGTNAEGLDVYRCLCGLERTNVEIAAEIEAQFDTRAAS